MCQRQVVFTHTFPVFISELRNRKIGQFQAGNLTPKILVFRHFLTPMQISSSHSGFNFNSVYKSVVARSSSQAGNPSTAHASAQSEYETAAEKLNRDALLLKAAQRSVDRSAGELEKLPEL